jgi:hypothetical protein
VLEALSAPCALLTQRTGGGYPWKREAEAEAEPKGPVAECFGNGCKSSLTPFTSRDLQRIGGGYPWKREAEAEAEPKGPVAECFGNGCKSISSVSPYSQS